MLFCLNCKGEIKGQAIDCLQKKGFANSRNGARQPNG